MAGFNFGFFGNQEHRVFNYKPRYYDVEAEERRKMFGDVDGTNEEAAKNGTANRAWVEKTLADKGYEIIDDCYRH